MLLNCLVFGDEPDQTFVVEVEETKSISILKKAIKEEKAPQLNHISASALDLLQVFFPIDDLKIEWINFNFADYLKLSPPTKKLSTFFKEVAEDCVHIIIKVPGMSRNFSFLVLPPFSLSTRCLASCSS